MLLTWLHLNEKIEDIVKVDKFNELMNGAHTMDAIKEVIKYYIKFYDLIEICP